MAKAALPKGLPVKTVLGGIALSVLCGSSILFYNGYRGFPSKNHDGFTSFRHVPTSYATSDTVTRLIKPDGSKSWDDTRFVILKLPPAQQHLSDEQILARCTKGFFGGWVFALERSALRLPIWRSPLVSFPKQSTAAADVWTTQQISNEKLPEVDSVFFGAFQVLDKRVSSKPGEESYIDFGYGTYRSRFVGCHRFSLQRLGKDSTGRTEDGDVRLSMSCVTCKSGRDPEWAATLHRAYAMILFSDAVAEVTK